MLIRSYGCVSAPVHRKISRNSHSFHSRDEFAAVRALADLVFRTPPRKYRTFADADRENLALLLHISFPRFIFFRLKKSEKRKNIGSIENELNVLIILYIIQICTEILSCVKIKKFMRGNHEWK